jgi:Myosin head (motor domain)
MLPPCTLITTGNSPRSGGMTSSPFAGTTSSGSGSEGTANSKSNANVATPSKAVGQTVATRFTGSLHELTEVLARTQTRFVRCVKTNGLLKPQVFEKPSVLRQLKVRSFVLLQYELLIYCTV